MAYTPELNYEQSCTLRRIAWALGTPMTNALSEILDHVTKEIGNEKVCAACKDKTRCDGCAFSREERNEKSGLPNQ